MNWLVLFSALLAGTSSSAPDMCRIIRVEAFTDGVRVYFGKPYPYVMLMHRKADGSRSIFPASGQSRVTSVPVTMWHKNTYAIGDRMSLDMACIVSPVKRGRMIGLEGTFTGPSPPIPYNLRDPARTGVPPTPRWFIPSSRSYQGAQFRNFSSVIPN